MSREARDAVRSSKLVEGRERTTILEMAERASKTGDSIFISVDRLAYETGQNERTVQRHIGNALESGYLKREDGIEERGRGGRNKTTRYTLDLDLLNSTERPPWVKISQESKGRQNDTVIPVSEDSRKGDNLSVKGDSLSVKGDRMPPEPIVEPAERTFRYLDGIGDADASGESEIPSENTPWVEFETGDPVETGDPGNLPARASEHSSTQILSDGYESTEGSEPGDDDEVDPLWERDVEARGFELSGEQRVKALDILGGDANALDGEIGYFKDRYIYRGFPNCHTMTAAWDVYVANNSLSVY